MELPSDGLDRGGEGLRIGQRELEGQGRRTVGDAGRVEEAGSRDALEPGARP